MFPAAPLLMVPPDAAAELSSVTLVVPVILPLLTMEFAVVLESVTLIMPPVRLPLFVTAPTPEPVAFSVSDVEPPTLPVLFSV